MAELLLTGEWLDRLLREIENCDYCYVCGEHPSHDHGGKDCPVALLVHDVGEDE